MNTKISRAVKILLSLILFLLPWQTIWIYQEKFLNGAKWQYGTLGFYATEILLWLCIILFIIWFYKQYKLKAVSYKLKATKDRIFIFSLLLFIIYSLSTQFWSINPDITFQHSLHILEAIILFLMILTGPLEFNKAARWFVAGAAVQSALGIWQFFTQSTFACKWLGLAAHPAWEAGASIISTADAGRWLRAYGAFPHPNIFGGYLVASLILTFLLFQQEKNKKNKLTFCILHSAFCIQTAALFFTFSRSAWLAFAVWLIGLIIYGIKNKNCQLLGLTPYVLCLTTILSILFFPLVQTRFSQKSANEIQSTTERVSGYQEAWMIFKRHPVLGVGAGNYTVAAFVLNPNLPGWEYQPVHNVPLLILTELGTIGTVLLLLTIISLISYLKSYNMYHVTYNKIDHTKCYVLYVTCYMILLLFDHYLFSSHTGLLISAVFLGLISRNIRA